MSKIGFGFPSVTLANAGYGKFEALPDFGAPYAAFLLGSKFTDTPTKNLFAGLTGAGGDATIVGTPDGTGLSAGASAFTASIASGLMTVSAFTGTNATATPLTVGFAIYAGGVYKGTIVSLGTGTGGTGTYNLVSGVDTASTAMTAAAYLELPLTGRATYALGQAATLVVIAKSPPAQGLLSDYIVGTGVGNMSLLTVGSGGTAAQGFINDSAGGGQFTSSTASMAGADTNWTMFGLTAGAPSSSNTEQSFVQRSGAGRLLSVTGNRSANPIGNSVTPLRFGRAYSTNTINTKAAMIAVYTKVLSTSEIDELFAKAVDTLADIGETL